MDKIRPEIRLFVRTLSNPHFMLPHESDQQSRTLMSGSFSLLPSPVEQKMEKLVSTYQRFLPFFELSSLKDIVPIYLVLFYLHVLFYCNTVFWAGSLSLFALPVLRMYGLIVWFTWTVQEIKFCTISQYVTKINQTLIKPEIIKVVWIHFKIQVHRFQLQQIFS